MPDSITLLLTNEQCRAAKRWAGNPPTCEDYDCGYRFEVAEAEVSDLPSLARLLDALRAQPRVLVIRGTPLPGAPTKGALRRYKGQEACFEDKPHFWVMLDLDSWEDPNFQDDPAESAAKAREKLPDIFQKVSCYWQASGGAGFKPGARLHLWFWFDRAVGCQELKRWVRGWSVKVDDSLFNPVQPHYTADPILIDLPDPMRLRSGVLPGDPEVKLPRNLAINDAVRGQAESTLASALMRMRKAADGERNNTLYRQARRVAAFSAVLGDSARDKLIATATDAGLSASEAHATVNSAWSEAEPHEVLKVGTFLANLDLNDQGRPHASLPNLAVLLRDNLEEVQSLFATDVRTGFRVMTRKPPWREVPGGVFPTRLLDEDSLHLACWLAKRAKMPTIAKMTCQDAIELVASDVKIDSFRDYLDSIEWDGLPRLNTWLQRATNNNDPFVAIAGHRWLLSAVARTYRPGCKVDTMLVLIGPQGIRKSSLFRELAGPEHFAELQVHLDSDEAYMQTMGPAIVELPELSAMGQRQVEAIKAHLSAQVDRRRAKYARWVTDNPRRFVYVGTTNDDTFLQDTDNRRFWPVRASSQIDLQPIRELRDQLWAEAVVAFRNGDQWHLTDAEEKLAKAAQEGARQRSGLEEMLYDHIHTPQGPMSGYPPEQLDQDKILVWATATQVASALSIDLTKQSKSLAHAFKALGWSRRTKRLGKKFAHVYERPDQ